MIRVGWLADYGNQDGIQGGAELTQAEFRAAAPEGVEIVTVPPSDPRTWLKDCDTVCVFNSVTYPRETINALAGKPVVRYWSDQCPHGDPELRNHLLLTAQHIFCSPLHVQRFPWYAKEPHHVIPPPVDLERFRAVDNGQDREGNVSVAQWRGWGKTPHLTAEWGKRNGGIDFYGPGHLAPPGSADIPYEAMPALLARYKRFVYLPTALEPFCRAVIEAWAAGCEVVTNRLVGARYFIEEDQDALETASDDFWKLVTQ